MSPPYAGHAPRADALVAATAAVATEITASLAYGGPLRDGGAASILREALLRESADESAAAEARCERLRRDIARTVWRAVGAEPRTRPLLGDGARRLAAAAPVRAEVRGTASRSVLSPAFAVGGAAQCDVQVAGDASVCPLHCLVVSLPAGLVVADFWSAGGTSVTWRQRGDAPATPILSLGNLAAFTVPQGERMVLSIGAKTTVTLGLDGSEAKPVPPQSSIAKPADGRVFSSRWSRPAISEVENSRWSALEGMDGREVRGTVKDSTTRSCGSSRMRTVSFSRSRSRSRSPVGWAGLLPTTVK